MTKPPFRHFSRPPVSRPKAMPPFPRQPSPFEGPGRRPPNGPPDARQRPAGGSDTPEPAKAVPRPTVQRGMATERGKRLGEAFARIGPTRPNIGIADVDRDQNFRDAIARGQREATDEAHHMLDAMQDEDSLREMGFGGANGD